MGLSMKRKKTRGACPMSAKKKIYLQTEEFQKLDNNLAVEIAGIELTVGEIKNFFMRMAAEQKNKEVRFDGRSKL